MEELWKPITCLPEGDKSRQRYEASNQGRIRNARTHHIITPHIINTGYYTLSYRVYVDGNSRKSKFKSYLWHRAIAMTWIPNPDNLPQIDHIDDDKCNNHPSNLRWVSAQENCKKAKIGGRPKLGNKNLPVYEINRDGVVVRRYENAREAAAEKGINERRVLKLCCDDLRPRSWGTFTQESYQNYLGKTIVEDGDHYKIIDLNKI